MGRAGMVERDNRGRRRISSVAGFYFRLTERIVRVEEGLLRVEEAIKNQNLLIDKRFEAMEKRFEAIDIGIMSTLILGLGALIPVYRLLGPGN